MTVHFVGAGPGAADLLTLRGRDRIAASPVCLYAGSLIPDAVLAHAPDDARVVNTAAMHLDEIMAEFEHAAAAGRDVARLHSGDLSVYSAVAEQVRRLEVAGLAYTLTPGVPAFAAAAATLGRELTVPEVAQSVVLTRTQGRASAMPAAETLERFAASGATLAIHLSLHTIDTVTQRLIPYYGGACPAAVVLRASWPDERALTGRLDELAAQAESLAVRRSAVILVGPALAPAAFRDSALYDADYVRRFRERPPD